MSSLLPILCGIYGQHASPVPTLSVGTVTRTHWDHLCAHPPQPEWAHSLLKCSNSLTSQTPCSNPPQPPRSVALTRLCQPLPLSLAPQVQFLPPDPMTPSPGPSPQAPSPQGVSSTFISPESPVACSSFSFSHLRLEMTYSFTGSTPNRWPRKATV